MSLENQLKSARDTVEKLTKLLAVKRLVKEHILYALVVMDKRSLEVHQMVYKISLPRGIGKTTAFNELKAEGIPNVVFLDRYNTECTKGRYKPFGEYPEAIVFDDTKFLPEYMSAIKKDWPTSGYNHRPFFIHITT